MNDIPIYLRILVCHGGVRKLLLVSMFLAAMPMISSAATISQLDAGTRNDLGQSNPVQSLGVGLSGTFESLEVKYHCFNGFYSLWIREYNNEADWLNNHGSLTKDFSSTNPKSGGVGSCSSDRIDTWLASDFSREIVFDPSKFYIALFYQHDGQFYGSSNTSAYSNGMFCSYGIFNNQPFVCEATVKDIYFVLNVKPDVPELEPVIIVPGIMGSRLNRVSDGVEVWPNFSKMIAPGQDSYLDDLILTAEGSQNLVPLKSTGIIEREFIFTFYGNLIQSLKEAGYQENKNLFLFSYDWRSDIRNHVGELSNMVSTARENSADKKVTIIAHSLGGILATQYLRSLPDPTFIEKLITVGVPRLGSPSSFKALNYGDDLNMRLIGLGLNQERIKIVSQNMPSIYELLPSRKYIQANGSYVKDFRSGASHLDFAQTKQFMLENPNDSRNASLIDLADSFHSEIDNHPIVLSNVYSIVGCQNPQTIGEFRIYQNGKFDIGSTNGDGTVPLASAMNLANDFSNFFVRYDKTGIDHTGLVKDPRTVDLIGKIIKGETINLPEGISTSTATCFETPLEFENETTVAFSTHSPVALHVYDAEGRHTGPLPSGDLELGIPLSAYERIGENNFAFLPAGNYKVVIDGLAPGSFDFKIKKFNGSELTNTATFVAVPLKSDRTAAELDFSSNSNLELKIDEDGNGLFELIKTPTAMLSDDDAIPPEIAIISPQPKSYLRSETVPIVVTAADNDSGVAVQEVKFDGKNATSSVDLFFEKLGEHSLAVHTIDKAGNPRDEKVSVQVVATAESTLSDLIRAYKLGWISNRGVKESLGKKIEAVTKFIKPLKVDKFIVAALLKELGIQHRKGVINDEAYDILREDLEWLLK